jgi:hypothetical protein
MSKAYLQNHSGMREQKPKKFIIKLLRALNRIREGDNITDFIFNFWRVASKEIQNQRSSAHQKLAFEPLKKIRKYYSFEKMDGPIYYSF